MATPTNDSYSVASGVTIYAGRDEPVVPPPAWRSALSTLTWAQIGSNEIMDVDPEADPAINGSYPSNAPWQTSGGLDQMCGQWNGGAMDDINGRYWVGGGGHAGYKGNEMYSIDLTADAPAWSRRGYPSGSIQHPIANVDVNGANSSLMTDGRPQSVHTYNLLSCRANGDLVLCASGAQWSGSGWTGFGYAFDHSADDWDTGRAFAGSSRNNYSAGSSCYDPVRDLTWCFSGDGVTSYTADGTKTERFNTNGNQAGYYSCMVYDSLRDLIVVFSGAAGSGAFASARVFFFDPDSPTAFTVAPQDHSTYWGTYGMGYDAANDRYLTWSRSGNNLSVITPPASSPGTNTWVSSTLTCSGTLTAAAANGTWGRLQVSNKYNCVFLLNATGEKLQALALD